jgi:hypothetical protein
MHSQNQIRVKILYLRCLSFYYCLDGKTGWFPSNYVEEISEKTKADATDKEIPGRK